MLSDTLSFDQLAGYVRATNEHGETVEGKNIVVYNGGDIIMKCLAGNPTYRLSIMYFAYENTAGTPTPPTPARTDTVAYFTGLVAPKDYIVANIILPVTLAAADGNHLYNKGTFVAISNGVVGEHGVAFTPGANSKVVSIGLVARPTGLIGGDVLYAHYALGTALNVVGTGQITVAWDQVTN